MPDEFEFINIELQSGVAVLSLNRPPLNVLHIPMLEEMDSALDVLADDQEVRVLILAAEGKMFSAGVDIADHTPEKVGVMIPLFDRVCLKLAQFPVPTVAAVHGHALGGGCELVLCCDLAGIAGEAKIGQPEIQLAAFAPVAALRLRQLIGYRAAADMLFSGENLSADQAMEIGLVNAVLPAEQVGAWAREKAARMAGFSRAAQILNKKALGLGFQSWQADVSAVEDSYLNELMITADALEGLAAFQEKRPPQWKHK